MPLCAPPDWPDCTCIRPVLDTNVLPDVLEDADIRDIDASFQTGHHEYLEDSDFEDGEIVLGPDSEEQSEAEDDTVEETVIDSADTPDANETTNPAPAPASESDSLGRGEGSKGATEALNVETAEDGDETANVVRSPRPCPDRAVYISNFTDEGRRFNIHAGWRKQGRGTGYGCSSRRCAGCEGDGARANQWSRSPSSEPVIQGL